MTELSVGEGNKEKEKPHIPYKAFKTMDSLEPGIIVTNVKPAKLYASQTWTDQAKIKKALNTNLHEGEVLTARGYWHTLPTGRRIIVLGDGHHKGLLAWMRGLPFQVEMVGQLPEGQSFLPFSQFRRRAGDDFFIP